MSNLSSALQQLGRSTSKQNNKVEKLQSAISVVEGLVGRNGSRASRNGVRRGCVTSVAARRRMALAQKARWAKARQESKPSAGKTNSSLPVKRTMSVAARRKIAAAQRARWAKF